MNEFLLTSLISFLAVMNFFGIVICVYDKFSAKFNSKNRVAEKFLFFLAIAGGAPAMFLCMLIIRHKTRHAKFMVGFPLIIIVQLIIAYQIVRLVR